jgi:hypothetical protein
MAINHRREINDAKGRRAIRTSAPAHNEVKPNPLREYRTVFTTRGFAHLLDSWSRPESIYSAV